MDIKVNKDIEGGDDSSLSNFGRVLQSVIQVPLFIIVGILVMVWETASKLFHLVYSQGVQHGAELTGPKPASAPPKVKVPILPIDNYSRLDADGVVRRLNGLSLTELMVVKNFENSHEKRVLVLEAIEQRLREIH